MNVVEAIARISASLRSEPPHPDFEGLVAGNPTARLTGIATCFTPSIKVLREAAARGCNLVIADGHPFYTYDSAISRLGDTQARLASSDVVAAKRRFIEDHRLTVFRIHSAWDAAMPSAGSQELATALGFTESSPVQGGAVGPIKRQKASDLLSGLLSRGYRAIRCMGDPGATVGQAAFANGLVSVPRMQRLLSDPAVDIVFAGEVKEWEGGPYFLDAIACGRSLNLVLLGFAPSMQPQARAMAQFVRPLFPQVAVAEINPTDPLIWAPGGCA